MNVSGVYNPSSIGISRYCAHLASALPAHGVEYVLRSRPNGDPAHLHFGNSSRGVAAHGSHSAYTVTVHDVIPRIRALQPLQRAALARLLRRAETIVVHSRFAADLLLAEIPVDAARVEIIPHGTAKAKETREEARRALGWPTDELVAVLPGVVKRVKLAVEALEAAAPLVRGGELNFVLAGRVADRRVATTAAELGATVLDSPDDETYERVLAAADIVLVLRSSSVGETNGPLLDALGSRRAVLATATGSIPEIAGDAAVLCAPTVTGIRAGLTMLADGSERRERETAAAGRAAAFSWDSVARAHAELFREAFDG